MVEGRGRDSVFGAARGGPTRGVLPPALALRKSDLRRYHRRVRLSRLVLGGLLVLTGVVWTAQGLNLPWAPGSFMTADRTWVLIGAVTVVAGVAVAASTRRPS